MLRQRSTSETKTAVSKAVDDERKRSKDTGLQGKRAEQHNDILRNAAACSPSPAGSGRGARGSNPRSWVAPRAIFPGVGRAARVSSQSVDLSIPLSGKYRGSFAQAQRNCTHEAHNL